MALEALKQYAAGQEQAINAKIESLAKSDPTERPTIVLSDNCEVMYVNQKSV